jgi:protein-S-isoprenylcysteine O-methyltransferase Ste14
MSLAVNQLSPQIRAGIVRRATQIAIMFLIQAALLFVSAGRFDWMEAWVYLGISVVGVGVNSFFMFRYSPETIARRATSEGMKEWDKIVSGLYTLFYFILLLVIAGLDSRFGWTAPLPTTTWLLAIIVYVLGNALFSWAMISNAYFAAVVRVETAGGHQVCTTGPYRYVRHPGYVGAILQALALPLVLGSMWALLPGIIAAVLLVVRTALEDHTLHYELDGYPSYAEKVRYRLLSGVW